MQPKLAIVLDDGSRSLRVVATLSDRKLLTDAAFQVIASAYRRAARETNAPRAEFQKMDAGVMASTLAALLPELRDHDPDPEQPRVH
jgi:hypothetical protein